MAGEVDPRKAQIQAQFDRIVDDYDTNGPGNFAYFGERLLAAAGVSAGERLLDVATGRGAVLLPAAARVGDGGEAIGIDLSERMVRAAAAEAARRGLKADVRVMDAEQLDFPDASFDCATCGFGIMFFPDVVRALGEMRRVLKPGGRLAVSTWRRSQVEDLSEVLAGFNLAPPVPPGWITEPERLVDLLKAASFEDVRVSEEVKAFRYANLNEYWQNARGTGVRGAIDSLEPEMAQRVRDALAERLAPMRGSDGWDIPASALIATARR